MSVQSEIDRIKKNVDDTLKAISDTGVQVGTGSDALPAAARALANEKQNKLTGIEGQFVGFDSSGAQLRCPRPPPFTGPSRSLPPDGPIMHRLSPLQASWLTRPLS